MNSIIVRPFGTRAQRQAILSFDDTHFIIGSAMIRDTHSTPTRPIDLLLATLAADCAFTCQEGAGVLGLALAGVMATACWEQPQTACIRLTLNGLDMQQAGQVIAYVGEQSDLYRMLSPVLNIKLIPG